LKLKNNYRNIIEQLKKEQDKLNKIKEEKKRKFLEAKMKTGQKQ
jgi:hypothetical protein